MPIIIAICIILIIGTINERRKSKKIAKQMVKYMLNSPVKMVPYIDCSKQKEETTKDNED